MSHLHKITLTSSAMLLLSLTASAQITFTKGFFQGLGTTPQLNIPTDATTTATLRFTITNLYPGPLSNIAFTDTLPAGLVVATPNGLQGTCGGGGTITAVAGSNTISLTGGSLQAAGGFDNCSFVVNVVSPVGTTPGVLTNTTGTITATGVTAGTATAAITALALTAPSLTKAFTAPFIGVGGTTTLTFTITNTNATALTGVTFGDILPPGLLIANPNGVTTTCPAGAITAAAGTNIFGLANGTVNANTSCTISVQVLGTANGLLTNGTSAIGAANAAIGAAATAVLLVIPADVFQVRYASNLAIGDSVIDFTNTGASSTVALPVQNGNLCVNAYVFSPDEQLISCCSCAVTPNGLQSLSARNDLISNTLTPGVPTSVVVKLLASSQATCNASTVTPASLALAPGLAAWGTTIHPAPVTAGTPAGTFGITETPFTPATLSPAELTRLTTLCSFNQVNGSGFGICKACRLGGLGADRQ